MAGCPKVQMLFPYKAAQAGQLDVERNEVLDNISTAETKRSHPGWLLVRSADGRRKGFVPQNHTKSVIPKGPATAEAVFGVPLRELLTRPTEQGDVPQVVLEMLERLEELGAARQDGIFRWPGSAATCAQIQTAYDRGERGARVKALSDNAADWATVLQRWNRALPQPLIPWAAHDPSMQRLVQLGKMPDLGEPSSCTQEEVLAVVQSLPTFQRHCLERQLEFMRTIEFTAIPSHALAKMLAPDWFGNALSSELKAQTGWVQKLLAYGRTEAKRGARNQNQHHSFHAPAAPGQETGSGGPKQFGMVAAGESATTKKKSGCCGCCGGPS